LWRVKAELGDDEESLREKGGYWKNVIKQILPLGKKK